MPPGNSFYIIQGEMTIILTAMRRTSRWGSHSYQDSSPEGILKDFADLKDVMNHVMNFSDLDPNTYLAPFLDVIRSEEITGPVTGLALSAVNKFLSYGLIDEKSPTAAPAVEAIADAVTHARFVGTDNASDEVVLMKILQVLRTLLLSPVGALLTNESVCEIMQSSFRICFEMRLSELLRKAAEHSLMDLVQLLFSRLRLMSEEDCSGAQTKAGTLSWIQSIGQEPKLKVFKKLRFKTGSLESRKKQKHKPKMEKEKESLPVTKMQRGVSQVPEVVKADHLPEIQARPSLVIPIVHVESPSEGSVDPGEEQPLKTPVERLAPVAASAILSTTPMPPSGKIIHMDLGSPLDSIHEDIGKDEQKEVEVEKAYSDLEGETGIPLDSSVHESGVTVSFPPEEKREYVNQQGVRFTHHLLEKPSEENAGEVALIPYGLPALRELLHFLSALINPHEKQHTDLMIHISLNLLAVALEAGAHHFHRFPSMLTLVRNDMARNLIEASTERLSMFAATLRVGFFLFESLRVHLKFQLEKYLIRLMGVIVADTPRIPYEQREVALDSIVQLWRIPGLVTELYVNYDCDLNCSNLFEDLTKLLSKNAFPVTGLYSTHLLSVDALLTVIDAIEHHCNSRMLAERHQMGATTLHSPNSPIPPPPLLRGSQQTSVEEADYRPSFPVSENIPTHEELMAVKHKKKLLAVGSEQFNIKASKGIQFMQDNMLLSNMLDPDEVALFLRDNHRLDKKMIGEYISNRKNLSILEAFVKSFDFRELRIDEALRLYLETFRLPGEAPLISLIMEHFADHWHKSNGEPFANADAAFTLAYAIIMLNVDQHNRNVKKQNNPMTVEDFKRNLKGVNGGFDFDQEMLDKIFMSIQ
ncbi:unnamed protein product [Darwinula stevensoni]|uniref:SEC7 domain-containing protein n=1 Tax=Darwinula stevensoni TaxID=69355 RepID=A0A7R9AE00_9CRUS|nr:unnamed protein product [Darwinula stevensoni]CAG0901854.1 unnamed protein product [Darwinula stevensoni]